MNKMQPRINIFCGVYARVCVYWAAFNASMLMLIHHKHNIVVSLENQAALAAWMILKLKPQPKRKWLPPAVVVAAVPAAQCVQFCLHIDIDLNGHWTQVFHSKFTQHIGTMKTRIQLPQHIEILMAFPGVQYIAHLDGHQCTGACVSL